MTRNHFDDEDEDEDEAEDDFNASTRQKRHENWTIRRCLLWKKKRVEHDEQYDKYEWV